MGGSIRGVRLAGALQALHLISESKEALGLPTRRDIASLASPWLWQGANESQEPRRWPWGPRGQVGCWARLMGRVEPQATPEDRTQLSRCTCSPPAWHRHPTSAEGAHTHRRARAPSLRSDLFQAWTWRPGGLQIGKTKGPKWSTEEPPDLPIAKCQVGRGTNS